MAIFEAFLETQISKSADPRVMGIKYIFLPSSYLDVIELLSLFPTVFYL